MSETCSRCGLAKPAVLILQSEQETTKLCQDCADKFCESDERYPHNQKLHTVYFGRFPQEKDKRRRLT